jgi:hypothetical protein
MQVFSTRAAGQVVVVRACQPLAVAASALNKSRMDSGSAQEQMTALDDTTDAGRRVVPAR